MILYLDETWWTHTEKIKCKEIVIVCPKPFWCHFGIGTAKIKALLLLTMPKLLHKQPGYVVIDKFKLPDGTTNEQSLRKSAKAYLESKGLLSKYGINMSSAFCKDHTDCSQRFHFSRVDDEPQYITVASLGDHGTTQQSARLKLDMLKTYGTFAPKLSLIHI